ncbi:hypothetical protein FHS18_001010 [Paenibacillus phyllosphaerae]|uniref:Uncharacterized protein n=1 Tax=Paenibacillus phyllosphaerae TaxID=274593 RepID=A0A7W5FLC6_9BACL|nr:hypothetical protein [Paenibacillus phyllosphaerae]MBB3108958.1 hypothetical protein [Paenibacillus phyllosphaerae]
MRRQPLQWAMLGGMIVLVVMFGIDLATSGVERIYGPVEQSEVKTIGEQTPVSQTPTGQASATAGGALSLEQTASSASAEVEQFPQQTGTGRTVGEAQRDPEGKRRTEVVEVPAENERLPGIPDLHEDTTVNKLADGTAGVLQTLSNQGIRFVVSLFESVTD